MRELNPDTKKRLMHISTATLATLLFKRGLRNQFIQGIVRLSKSSGNMVGPAFTLRYMPAREDRNGIEVFQTETTRSAKPLNSAHQAQSW